MSDGDIGGLSEGWDYSGSIRAPKKHTALHPSVRFDRVIKVQTTTLDKICSDLRLQRIDFLWMDVQGAESDICAGGANILRNVDYIYTEYSNEELYEGQASLKDLQSLLPDFEILVRYGNDVLFRNRRLASGLK